MAQSPGYNPAFQMGGRKLTPVQPGTGPTAMSPLAMGGGGNQFGMGSMPGAAPGGVTTPDGKMDRVTLAMMLMQALGTGFTAYSQAQQAKKDREQRQRGIDELSGVRARGREGLLTPPAAPAPPKDFFTTGQTLQSGVAGPPPVGPSAERDEELQAILRARLGGMV